MPPASIIVNSIPKSGTYLLAQLVNMLGAYPQAGHLHFNDQHYTTGTDENGALQIIKMPAPGHLSALPPHHSAAAHLTWSQALDDALLEQNIGMFFMYRDPRDLVISYVKFAMYSEVYRYETEGHKQYYEFLCTLENDQRRAEHLLRHRLFLFQFYENAPWLFSDACLPVSFEALYKDTMMLREGTVGKTIEKIMRRMGIDSLSCSPQMLFEQVFAKSKTAMGKQPNNHQGFFDDGLWQATDNPFFRSVMHMYGYA